MTSYIIYLLFSWGLILTAAFVVPVALAALLKDVCGWLRAGSKKSRRNSGFF